MPDPVDLTYVFSLPPADAVKYFQSKGYVVSWNWYDLWQQAHNQAFTVAKATRLDILQDIRGAVDRAISEGITFQDFQKELTPTLQAKGWWGKAITEEGKAVMLGSPHRLETIFRTNVQVAYNAGRYQQQVANADNRPYLQYISVMDARTRPDHAALHGKVFRYDDPFWDTHYPPIAYRCRCRVRALTEKQVQSRGLEVESGDGRMAWEDRNVSKDERRPVAGYRDPKTGETFFTDPGWSSNPGKESWDIDPDKYDPDIRRLI
jgi:SPP1 gp7 family putative phage head morphogenesis protein